MAFGHISVTMTYVMWPKEHLWNVKVLFSGLVNTYVLRSMQHRF